MTDGVAEEAIARFDIGNAKARHIRALDCGEWEVYAALVTEDFTLDTAAVTRTPPVVGREAAVAAVRAMVFGATMVHHVHPGAFRFDGDEAHVVWPMQDRMTRGPDVPSMAGYGHHHDVWVRRADGWRLRSQRLTRLHTDVLPPA